MTLKNRQTNQNCSLRKAEEEQARSQPLPLRQSSPIRVLGLNNATILRVLCRLEERGLVLRAASSTSRKHLALRLASDSIHQMLKTIICITILDSRSVIRTGRSSILSRNLRLTFFHKAISPITAKTYIIVYME